MKLRYKNTSEIIHASCFNVHALAEIDVGNDSVYIRDLDVFIGGNWKDLNQAFRDRDVVPDNYNEYFAEPKTNEDRARGYND